MNTAKFIAVYNHFKAAEPAVVAEVQQAVKILGPAVVSRFPQLAGYESELESGLDFLSKSGGTVFANLDQAFALLESFSPPASA